MSTPDAVPSAPGPGLPRWARVLDALAVFAGALFISVLVFGGFRVQVGGLRVSITEWWRPLALTLLLVVARHYGWRRDPVWTRVWRTVAVWWTSPDTRAVLPIHLATRLGVLAVGFFAVVLIGFPRGKSPIDIYSHALLDLPARWDTGWYLTVVREGYHWSADNPRLQQNIAFFPAYPLIVRWVSVVCGRQPLWTAVAVSLVAFFGALVYLRRLARDQLADEEQAATAIAFLSTYPFALYFSAAYAESLFLLCVAGAIFHFRRGELWPAAAWGGLCGLTRPNGAFLSVVLGLMVFGPAWRDRRAGRFPWGVHLDRLATAAMPGIGMLVYSTYIQFLTGHPFQWVAQNVAWGRQYRSLDTLVTDRVAYVSSHGVYAYASSQTIDMFHLAAALFILGAAWPVYRRFGLPYAMLLLVNLLPPMAAGGLMSIGRVTSVLFPAFFWLAAVVPARHRMAWVALFACLQGFGAAMFFTWRPLF